MKVGLGITTYNRPDYLSQCLKGVKKHLVGVTDTIWCYNDGSSTPYDVDFPDEVKYYKAKKNKGVAVAKNWLLRQLIKEGCDYIFLLEDDIVPQSPKAITEYIRLSKKSGIEHFLFAHHGTGNVGKLYLRKNGVDLYTACIGAYCMYTARVINRVGYMDENFKNAFEHVEHTFRIAKAGYTTPFPTYPDVAKSKEYLAEIPDSINNSSIRVRKDWLPNVYIALLHWRDKDPDFPFKEKLESLTKEIEAAQ